jgi:hypothetical protein
MAAVKLKSAAQEVTNQMQVISAFAPKRAASNQQEVVLTGADQPIRENPRSGMIGKLLISLSQAAAPVVVVKQKILCINYDAWRTRYMISPDNPFYIIWNAIVSVITTVIGIAISYKMAFSLTEPNFSEPVIPYLVVGYCIILSDLLVEFNLKFYEKGHMIACRKLAFMNAMRNGIYWKLIPFAGFFFRAVMRFDIPEDMVVLQVLLDLLYVYRIITLFSSLDKYSILFKLSRTQMGLIYLISLLANLVFMLHYFACIW